MAIARTLPPDEATEEGLQRRLTSRQLTMIAIGSAIGVGLFLGSTVTIGLAGPGVIVTYVFGAAIALVMGYALAEMAVVHPLAGSFGVYAASLPVALVRLRRPRHLRLHPDPGDRRGGDGGRHLLRVLVSRRAAVGLGRGDVASALIAVNTAQVSCVRRVRVLVRADQGGRDPRVHRRRPRADHRHRAVAGDRVSAICSTAPADFSRNGWRGVWLALTLVITSYMGIEGIAVTAGEARAPGDVHPARDADDGAAADPLLRARDRRDADDDAVARRLAEGGRGITGSPFVRAFAAVGIPYAAGVMNLVVDLRGGVEREFESLHDRAHAALAVALGLRAAVAGDRDVSAAACRCARWRRRAPAWRWRFCWRFSRRPTRSSRSTARRSPACCSSGS